MENMSFQEDKSPQLNIKMEKKMKNLIVLFSIVASILMLVSGFNVSAAIASGDLARDINVKVNGIYAASEPSVVAGETIIVEVSFDANRSDTDVRVEVELESGKDEVRVISYVFDVEEGYRYSKSLKIEVPFGLKDEISENLTLNVEIDGKEFKTNLEEMTVRVQRPSYNPVLKSVSVSQSITAGETFPVDIVLKNMGYNDLDDVYVEARISELGIYKSTYFGDLVNLEVCDDDCDKDDTVSGRLYLEVPYGAKEGSYTLEVEVSNDDSTLRESKEIVIGNDFANNVIVSNTHQSTEAGEDAEYSFMIVNPTNNVKVYRIVSESSSDLTSTVSSSIVAVPAGSSTMVNVFANAAEEGEYTFNVNVFAGESLDSTIAFTMTAEDKTVANPMVVLTVILAIVFLVLLVVLIVLIGKKPEKSEEFGESYY